MSFSAAVADPQDLTRHGTTRLLEALGARVITGTKGGSDLLRLPDLLDLLSAGELDLVVTEMSVPEASLPEAGGPALLRGARAEGLLGTDAEAAALVLTAEEDEGAVREAFRLGAAGYALKSDPLGEIEAAVKAVLQGDRFLSEALPRSLMEEAVAAGPSAGPPNEGGAIADGTRATRTSGRRGTLCDREREVLRLTAQGLTNKEVGKALSIGRRAVEKCQERIQAKLRLSDRVEMVRYAARNEIL